MSKPRNKGSGTGSRPTGNNGNGKAASASLQARPARAADPGRNEPLIEKVRQIIEETPEIRDGRLRSQGPFAHAILAGSVGAVCAPLIQDPDTPV